MPPVRDHPITSHAQYYTAARCTCNRTRHKKPEKIRATLTPFVRFHCFKPSCDRTDTVCLLLPLIRSQAKQVDQVEARHGNDLAMKQEVSIPDIIAHVKANAGLSSDQIAMCDRYLEKYKSGTLKAPACFQLLRTTIGMDKVKWAMEQLVPGYTHTWAPQHYEHPIIV